MESSPSEIVGDNNSLNKRIQLDVTNKGKALRKMSRLINIVKGAIQIGQIKSRLVGTKKMKANPLTKVHHGPTEHWREAEWLLGSSAEIRQMQQMAKDGARRGKATAEATTDTDDDDADDDQIKQQLQLAQDNMRHNKTSTDTTNRGTKRRLRATEHNTRHS
jgi:hypothetical protein